MMGRATRRWQTLADRLGDEMLAAGTDEIAAALAETGLSADILAGQIRRIVLAALAAEEAAEGLPPPARPPGDQAKP